MGLTKKRCPRCKKKRAHLSRAARSQGQLFGAKTRQTEWALVDGQMICPKCVQEIADAAQPRT